MGKTSVIDGKFLLVNEFRIQIHHQIFCHKTHKANREIYHSMIDIVMAGELIEWSTSVLMGEVHHFEFDLFKKCDDINIQEIVSEAETIEQSIATMKNLNDIEIEESETE